MNQGFIGFPVHQPPSLAHRTIVGQDVPVGPSVSFDIPAGYNNARLTMQARGDAAAVTADVRATFNGDSGTNYDWKLLYATSAVSFSEGVGVAFIVACQIPAASAAANAAGNFELYIPNYAGSVFRKGTMTRGGLKMSDAASTSGSTGQLPQVWMGEWRNTSPLVRLTLTLSTGNFVAGSTFTLYLE